MHVQPMARCVLTVFHYLALSTAALCNTPAEVGVLWDEAVCSALG
jgi:hypothetical protein